MTLSSIFLSYARNDDKLFVRKLYKRLITEGFSVWFDCESMPSRDLSFLQEIRDAISNIDQLILVIGPSAALETSYVRPEWGYALSICKRVIPILRLGDFDLLPSELNLRYCIDMRKQRPFDEAFAELLVKLNDPTAPLGKLVAVPDLPPHFFLRFDDLRLTKQLLLADIQKPVVITGTARRVGLHGMGGIGKSVLAVSIARDCEIRHAFPDGVYWITLGQSPNITSRQYDLCLAFGIPPPHSFIDVDASKSYLSTLLANKTCLLILDDIWQAEHVLAFDVLGSRCRMLLTTRDAELITALGACEYRIDVLNENDAITLMAGWLIAESVPNNEHPVQIAELISNLPRTARKVAHECGYLPLALALSAAQVRDGISWSDLLDALHHDDLEFFDHAHGSIIKSLKVSIDFLKHINPIFAQHYLEFAAFPEDSVVPEAAVLTLWLHKNCINERNARKLIQILARKALIKLSGEQPNRKIELHDLQHLYLRNIQSNLAIVHQDLLSAYLTKCSNGWHTGPDDGYFFEHLIYHLQEAGRNDDACDLLIKSPNWMEAKSNTLNSDISYFNDLLLVMRRFSDPLSGSLLVKFLQLITVKQVINSRVEFFSDTDLETLVYLDRSIEAENIATMRPKPYERFKGLLTIYLAVMIRSGKISDHFFDQMLELPFIINNEIEKVEALYQCLEILIHKKDSRVDRFISESLICTMHISSSLTKILKLSNLALIIDKIDHIKGMEVVEAAKKIFFSFNINEKERLQKNFSLPEMYQWSQSRVQLASVLLSLGSIDQAITIYKTDVLRWKHTDWDTEFINNIFELGFRQSAIDLANEIVFDLDRVKVLEMLAIKLTGSRDKRAEKLFCQAIEIVKHIENQSSYKKAEYIVNLYCILLRKKYNHLAQKLLTLATESIEQVDCDSLKSQLNSMLHMSDNQEITTIPGEFSKELIINARIIENLAKGGFIEDAFLLLDKLNDRLEKILALSCIAIQLVKSDDARLYSTLKNLISHLQLFQTSDTQNLKIVELMMLVEALIKKGLYDISLEIILTAPLKDITLIRKFANIAAKNNFNKANQVFSELITNFGIPTNIILQIKGLSAFAAAITRISPNRKFQTLLNYVFGIAISAQNRFKDLSELNFEMYDVIKSLIELVRAYCYIEDYISAMKTALAIYDEKAKVIAICELATTLHLQEKYAERDIALENAKTATSQIEDVEVKVSAICELVNVLHSQGKYAERDIFLRDVIVAVSQIDNKYRKSETFARLSCLLYDMNQFEQAYVVAKKQEFTSRDLEILAIKNSIKHLVSAKRFSEAWKYVKSFEFDARFNAIGFILLELLFIGKLYFAIKISREYLIINDDLSIENIKTICTIIKSFAEYGNIDYANSIVYPLIKCISHKQYDHDKVRMFCLLAEAYSSVGNTYVAKEMFSKACKNAHDLDMQISWPFGVQDLFLELAKCEYFDLMWHEVNRTESLFVRGTILITIAGYFCQIGDFRQATETLDKIKGINSLSGFELVRLIKTLSNKYGRSHEAQHLFQKLKLVIHSMEDSHDKKFAMDAYVDALIDLQIYKEAFMLMPESIDIFMEKISRHAPKYDNSEMQTDASYRVLFHGARIAGWIRSDWRKVNEMLSDVTPIKAIT